MTALPTRRRTRAAAVTLLAALSLGTVGVLAAQAAPGFTFDVRSDGATRVETAVASSKALYPTGGATGGSEDVVLVNMDAVVDGLTASYVAGLKNAPVLYSSAGEVPAATAAEITRLGAKRGWLVGGTTVLTQGLEDSLKASYAVTRFSGEDRYATAAAVATAGEFEPERLFVTSGTSLADAVLVGPVSWARNYPILLTEAGRVPAPTKAALDTLVTPERTVIGGTTVVSDATSSALGATKRLGGGDRQTTAVLVANDAVETASFTAANAALVGGENRNAVDALSASALAGATGTPLLYISGNDTVGPVAAKYLRDNRSELTGTGYVFGGQDAVSTKAAAEATAAAQ